MIPSQQQNGMGDSAAANGGGNLSLITATLNNNIKLVSRTHLTSANHQAPKKYDSLKSTGNKQVGGGGIDPDFSNW